MAIQIYILSKLIEGDNYPYQLKKELSEPVPFDKIGNITESKLYYHFESLTKQGLIEPTTVIREENRPDKQYFSITEKGREELPNKIYKVFEKATKMSELIIGLLFIRHVDVEKVIPLIQIKKLALEKKKMQMSEIYKQVKIPANVKNSVQLANDYMTEMSQREIEWYDRVILQLQEDNEMKASFE